MSGQLRTLEYYGERRLLTEVIFPVFGQGGEGMLGDDAAVLECFPGNSIVWTIDPCPLPVSWILGEQDYRILGWYTVAINLSDLAAMGAKPIGLLLGIEAPRNLPLTALKEFLHGARECAAAYECPVVGGNIKDADTFSSVGTGIGSVKVGRAWRRSGCREGDVLTLVGDLGRFWAAVLAKRLSIDVSPDYKARFDHALKRPEPKVREALALQERTMVSAAMDVSDGLVNCAIELAKASGWNISLTPDSWGIDEVYRDIFAQAGADPDVAASGWGDWQLVCAMAESEFPEAKEKMAKLGAEFRRIGEVRGRGGQALVATGGDLRPINRKLDGQRFAKTSYFSHGLDAFIDSLVNETLYEQ